VAGFFSSLFGPAWQKAAQRAEKAERATRWADAWHDYAQAIAEGPEEQRPAWVDGRNRCAGQLVSLNLARALEMARVANLVQAGEHLELAETFASTEALRQQVQDARRELTTAAQGAVKAAAAERAKPASQCAAANPDDDVMFDFVYPQFPEAVLDQYARRPVEWRRAVLARHRGELKQALPVLRAAQNKGTVERFEAGLAHAANGDIAAAWPLLRDASTASDAWPHVTIAAVDLCWAESRWDDAETVLQHAIDSQAESIDLYLAAATHAVLRKRPSEGLEAVEAALTLDGNNLRAQLLQARLFDLAGREGEAEPLYEAVVKRTWRFVPELRRVTVSADAAGLLAMLLLRKGRRLDRAEELLRAMASDAPDEARWRVELDLVSVLRKAGRGAMADLLLHDIAARADESSVSGRLRLAWLQNDLDDFRRRWAKAAAADRERYQEMQVARGEAPWGDGDVSG
jgi:tetratricopeptide (TPR) repeat protein